MLKKIALSLFLLMAGSLTAFAQEIQYIGVQGSWWNPDYAGEGFAIEEYGDGFVIAYWYTYDEAGQQMWLIGTGDKQGNTVELDMYRTEGGTLGSEESSENLIEELWGNVTLDVEDCARINMSYESLNGLSGGYQMMRLRSNPLAAGSCNAIEVPGDEPDPPPEDDPPPVDPPPEEPTAFFTIQKQLVTGEWVDVATPFTGLAVIHKTVQANQDRLTLFRLRIVANEGDVVVESFSATESTGISQPTMPGMRAGLTIPEGTDSVFSLESNTTGGVRVFPEFHLHIQGYGEAINLIVRLSTQSL